MIDVIMLIHDVQELATQAILHLIACTPAPLRFLLVDNGSQGDTLARLGSWLGPEHVYLRSETNDGVYAPTNGALALTRSDLVIWCATDHLVYPGWFAPLAHLLAAEPRAGWVAPGWTEGPFSIAEVWQSLPTPTTISVEWGRLASSCFVMHWPRLRDRVGLFDERFGIVYGDSDYRVRMRDTGVLFGVVREAKSRHLGHQTCRALGTEVFTDWERRDATAFREKYRDRPDVLLQHSGLDRIIDGDPLDRIEATEAHWMTVDPELPGLGTNEDMRQLDMLSHHDNLLAAKDLAECIGQESVYHEMARLTAHLASPEAFTAFYGTPTPERTFLPEPLLAKAHLIHQRCGRVRTRLMEQGARDVVELGCFDGWISLNLALTTTMHTEGVDCAAYAVAEANQRAARLGLTSVFHEAMLESIDLPPQYDAVLLLEVLEHVIDVDAAVAAAERLLRPGGRVYISCPKTAPVHQHERERREHVRLIDEPALRDLATRGGRTLVTYEAWTSSECEAHMVSYRLGDL